MSVLGEPLLLRAVQDTSRLAAVRQLLGEHRRDLDGVDVWELYDPAAAVGGPPLAMAATTPRAPAEYVVIHTIAPGTTGGVGDLERRLLDDVADALRAEGVAVLRASAVRHSPRAAMLHAAGFRPGGAAPEAVGASDDGVWFELEL